jgi:hypothetical protein
MNTVGVFPEREQRLVVSKDDPGSGAVYRSVVIVNAVVNRQKVFQCVVAPLYVVEQSFSLVYG